MTSPRPVFESRRSNSHRLQLALAIAGLLPGFAYLGLFLSGVLGLVDSVGLLSARLPASVVPVVITGLVLSVTAGLVIDTPRSHRFGLHLCTILGVVLMLVEVPLVLVQLVSLFSYYD